MFRFYIGINKESLGLLHHTCPYLRSSAVTYFRRDNEFSPVEDLMIESGTTRVIARHDSLK
ncbi:hypothetical protein ALC62_03259 [Cyphomyrmex costatus]|uniref:Uncharacterized protein n=1 Tax=Cyphomyrmex costatus TaxID=456900 RepID=A0A151ILL5_9HYME|nr:hypothetical protein ALC62_03259 [Cyphomyrmex costatus]